MLCHARSRASYFWETRCWPALSGACSLKRYFVDSFSEERSLFLLRLGERESPRQTSDSWHNSPPTQLQLCPSASTFPHSSRTSQLPCAYRERHPPEIRKGRTYHKKCIFLKWRRSFKNKLSSYLFRVTWRM